MRALDYEHTGHLTLGAEFIHGCGEKIKLTGHDDDDWFRYVQKYPRIVECKGCLQTIAVKWTPQEVFVWE